MCLAEEASSIIVFFSDVLSVRRHIEIVSRAGGFSPNHEVRLKDKFRRSFRYFPCDKKTIGDSRQKNFIASFHQMRRTIYSPCFRVFFFKVDRSFRHSLCNNYHLDQSDRGNLHPRKCQSYLLNGSKYELSCSTNDEKKINPTHI